MRAWAASLAVVLLGAGTLWLATDGLAVLTTEGARRLSALRDAPVVAAHSVETMDGGRQLLPADDGRASLIEFIYTTCPTICQAAGADMAVLRDRIEEAGLGAQVRLVSVSFDPQTDDVPQLASYGELHGADGRIWTIARPDPADLSEMLDTFGVTVIPDAFGGYEHNAAILVIGPDGRLRAIVDVDDVNGAFAAARRVLQ